MMHSFRTVFFTALILCTWLFGITSVSAQESLSVTVTPPLFQLSIGPGESWTSTIKVINNNSYDVQYAPQVVDFEAQGETGQGKFVPLINAFGGGEQSSNSLGSWIEISKDPVLIRSGQSAQLNFTVHVPQNAEPGGHYAAIMVGPHEADTAQGSHMKISSYVTSLIMVRIKGDIVESGRIREFTTDRSLYQKPEAQFVLRFENTGNTHLRPQGLITLHNMWGKERGQVLINEKSNFGNVLPHSIRKFEFTWNGEDSLFDIGLYSAVVTLNYGDDAKQNASATSYFWVVPVVPVTITLIIVLSIVLILMWFIRRYVRRALSLEHLHVAAGAHPNVPDRQEPPMIEHVSTLRALVQPIKDGVVDLRSVGTVIEQNGVVATPTYIRPLTFGGFVRKYRLFFAFLLVLAVLLVGISLYFKAVLVSHRDFQIKAIAPASSSSASVR